MNNLLRITKILSLFFVMFVLSSSTSNTETAEVKLIYEAESCGNTTINVYEFTGFAMKPIGQMTKVEENRYEYSIPSGDNNFFYVGIAANNNFPVILGQESKVVLKGNCRSFRSTTIVDSPINKQYNEVTTKVKTFNNKASTLSKEYQKNKSNSEALENTITAMIELDSERLDYLEEMKTQNPYLAQVVAFQTYLSYQTNGKGYKSEVDYYISEFFSFIDWKNENLSSLPWVYAMTREYAITTSSLSLPEENHRLILETILQEIPENSETYQLALAGFITGLKSKNSSNFLPFAQLFVEKYAETEPASVENLKTQLQQAAAFVVGGEAPDFTQNTPEGEPVSLSDLRGKVVLVDFWASWCGPCRRENPNVVRMYNKYKDKGFEILGVSLDNNKERWMNAIEADGLTWPHISDLKGWSNTAAQKYGVTSIPQTVLLDKDGKIIARNLRGSRLEAKLAEIFGI